MDKLTNSINPKYRKIIEKIFLTDSITIVYNELLPSLPKDVVVDLYMCIKKNLHLFTTEQKEKLKPIVTFYTNIKFTCSTKCNPVNNPGRSPLQDKEYGTKRDCLSKCPETKYVENESLLLTMSFLSLEDQLQYLISINKKELISKIQERDIYNPDIIISRLSPLEIQYRPYVVITTRKKYKKNPDEYKNVKYLYQEKLSKNEEIQYDVIYDITSRKKTIINIKYTGGGFSLVLDDKPLTTKDTIHLRKLALAGEFDEPFGDSLSKLTQLKELYLGGEFNQPLGDSLSKLTQLEILYLQGDIGGGYFNQPLGDSLLKLTKLKKLDLGVSFDQPLANSLSKLTQLKELNLGTFNQPLGDSLSKLTQLEKLNLGAFNQPLGESLSKLYQLKELYIGFEFNKSLGKSLSSLSNLEILNLGHKFNQPLGDSLSKLTQLKELVFSFMFDQQLGDSLSKLYQLKKLNFRVYFKQTLGDSLSKLTQLEILDLGNEFNHPLKDSLSKLTKLKKLNLGLSFDKPLGDGLSKLTQLKELVLGREFNQQLGDSLSKLTQLEILNLPAFDGSLKDLKNGLSELIQLKELYLGYKDNKPLEDSLSELIHLKILEFRGVTQTINIKNEKPISFTTLKNSEELKEMNFDELKQNIKDLRKKGYKISILSKMEDKADNRKLLRKILREIYENS